MLNLPSLPLHETNRWTLEESGLPIRVVNACTAADILTLGDLRKTPPSRLMELENFGVTSLEHCQSFIQMCDQLHQGSLQISTLQHWFEHFISEDGYDVISSRYGFYRSIPGVSRKFFTLQEIANRTQRTRERIRQIERSSLDMMKKRLPALGLLAILEEIKKWIRQQSGSAAWVEFDAVSTLDILDGVRATSLTLFLSDQFPGQLTPTETYCTLLPPDHHAQILTILTDHIPDPTPLPELTTQIASHSRQPLPSGFQLQKLIKLALQESDTAICTRSGLCGARTACVDYLLKNIMAEEKAPMTYKDLTQSVNQHLVPRQAIGSGTVLKALSSPDFKRLDSGLYQLLP